MIQNLGWGESCWWEPIVRRQWFRDEPQNMLRSDTSVTIMVGPPEANPLRRMTLIWSSVCKSPITLWSLVWIYDSHLENTLEFTNVPIVNWIYKLNCSQNQISLLFYLPWGLTASWACLLKLRVPLCRFLVIEYYFRCILNTDRSVLLSYLNQNCEASLDKCEWGGVEMTTVKSLLSYIFWKLDSSVSERYSCNGDASGVNNDLEGCWGKNSYDKELKSMCSLFPEPSC